MIVGNETGVTGQNEAGSQDRRTADRRKGDRRSSKETAKESSKETGTAKIKAEPKPIVIGTRGSPLALAQAHIVQERLAKAERIPKSDRNRAFPLKIYKTTGDALKGRLAQSGGKGLFVKELDEALESGKIDLAVHSLKDVPTQIESHFDLAAILEREDPRDAFISLTSKSLKDLPIGALVGTASLRRQAQASRLRSDLRMTLLRGNVGTRLYKLKEGECDATFLAAAGLNRLGQSQHIMDLIATDDMLPAPAQGAIAVQIRKSDELAMSLAAPLNHEASRLCVTAERALLKALDGSCRTPVAALAELDGAVMRLRGQALSPDGRLSFTRDETIELGVNPRKDAFAMGYSMGLDIRFEAGSAIQWEL